MGKIDGKPTCLCGDSDTGFGVTETVVHGYSVPLWDPTTGAMTAGERH